MAGLPGFEDLDTRRGNTYLPVAETLSCGTDTLFHYLCYAANLPQAPYTSLANAGARSLPALERWKSRGKTVTLTSSYQDFGNGKYSLSAQALSDGSTEIARQDYPKYDAYGNLLETSVNQGSTRRYSRCLKRCWTRSGRRRRKNDYSTTMITVSSSPNASTSGTPGSCSFSFLPSKEK